MVFDSNVRMSLPILRSTKYFKSRQNCFLVTCHTTLFTILEYLYTGHSTKVTDGCFGYNLVFQYHLRKFYSEKNLYMSRYECSNTRALNFHWLR